ncbi:MAG: DegT/DnrJ/EryC1/StrS family aminotransferase [Xanthobacteraceae bacterium]
MIPLYKPYLNGAEKLYVNQCLDSSWISSRGEFVSRFESGFERFVGIRHAATACNGTVALHLALAALGLGPGDEVIVPTLTYVASVNAIVHAGAKPVFVDAVQSTWQMDPVDVRRKITANTKAVLAVHLYGAACEMDELQSICRAHNLYLIEDCAEAFGTYYRDKHVDSFGDIATFSFFGNKTITTGEGGMIATNNSQLFSTAHRLKTQGVSPTREYWHEVIGYNYRMTNICAAIGVAQLEQAEQILGMKRQIAAWFNERLSGIPVTLQHEPKDNRQSWWLYSVLAKDAAERDGLRNALRLAGIETRPFFHPAHILPPYASGLHFPVAESLSARGINLPSFPGLSESDVDQICEAIRQYYGSRRSMIAVDFSSRRGA